ncbi:MAG: alpha/beta fold hydrolase [Rhodospirillales bacterium]|nr:alpha/beta fold hydrolase [Rhodospirillales bacterium]
MRETIQILVGQSQYIRASFAKPKEHLMQSVDRLLVIMVHGFPGDKNACDNVFADLEHVIGEKRYHTLRFDFRGCGASDGLAEDFSLYSASEDFKTVIKWAKDRGYGRFVFICEGLGAAIALMNAPKEARCYVLLWPMVDLPMIAQHVFQADTIEEDWKKAGYIMKDDSRISIAFLQQLKKAKMAKILKDLGKPLLIMHGAQDEVSPIEQLDMFRACAGHRRVEITSFQDGTHGLPQINHRKSMFFHIRQFIEKYT